MKALLLVTIHNCATDLFQRAAAAPICEADHFRALDRAARRQRRGRIMGFVVRLIPASLAARIAARRAERQLLAQIRHLESLSGHLLDDIGVEKVGPADYVVRSDDMFAAQPAPQDRPRDRTAVVVVSA
jgi:hypothetical protein